MNCCKLQNTLMDYLDGRLNQVQRLELDNHIASCTICSMYIMKSGEALNLLDYEKDTEYDPYMFTRIQALINLPYHRHNKTVFLRVLRPVLITCIIFAIAIAGIEIGRNSDYQNSLARDYNTELFYLREIHGNSYESLLYTE